MAEIIGGATASALILWVLLVLIRQGLHNFGYQRLFPWSIGVSFIISFALCFAGVSLFGARNVGFLMGVIMLFMLPLSLLAWCISIVVKKRKSKQKMEIKES